MNRGLAFGLAGAVTALGFAGSLWLGSWGYQTRGASLHQGRLGRLLQMQPRPTSDRIEAGLATEGGRTIGRADDEPASSALLRSVGSSSAVRHPRLLVVEVVGAVYVIWLDEDDRIADFEVLQR